MGLLDALGEFSHRLFRVGRNVRAYRLRIDQEQVERRVEVVEKIDDPSTPAFSCACPAPPHFADPSSIPDNVAGLGIPSYKINEGFALVIAPDVVGLAQERGRLGDGYIGLVHIAIIYAIGAVQQGKNATRSALPCPSGEMLRSPSC